MQEDTCKLTGPSRRAHITMRQQRNFGCLFCSLFCHKQGGKWGQTPRLFSDCSAGTCYVGPRVIGSMKVGPHPSPLPFCSLVHEVSSMLCSMLSSTTALPSFVPEAGRQLSGSPQSEASRAVDHKNLLLFLSGFLGCFCRVTKPG